MSSRTDEHQFCEASRDYDPDERFGALHSGSYCWWSHTDDRTQSGARLPYVLHPRVCCDCPCHQ